jgi:hypothetical protein
MPRYRLRTLLPRFTIRDLLWLTAVIALIVVWRSDLAWQEYLYLNMLRQRFGNNSSDVRKILFVAKRHPELLTELKAFQAADTKNMTERASLNFRLIDLSNKATDLYKRDRLEEEAREKQSLTTP